MNNIYKINNDKFKSIYFSLNFTIETNKKKMSENSLLVSILEKSCEKYKNQIEIQKFLYSLYGANFDIGIDKFGDLYNIEFRVECINKKFLPSNEDVVEKLLGFLYQIVFFPNIVNNKFDETIFLKEKEFVKNKIREIKDEKLRYGIQRTEEIMCNNEPFGVCVYGDENEIDNISQEDLYNEYLNILNNSSINFIVSGNLEGYDNIENTIKNIFGEKINNKRELKDLVYNIQKSTHEFGENIEQQETTQSVLCYGLRIKDSNKDDFYKLSVYNALLGGTPSSKLFQNFREKESLAYTVRTRYYRFKDMIIIYSGIKKENYEKAKKVIEKGINSIKIGDFTDEEFIASKDSLVSDLKEWKDSKIALSKMLISNLLLDNKNLSIDEMASNISKVTKQDIIYISNKINIEKIFFLRGEVNV